jgi:hypothetical protein
MNRTPAAALVAAALIVLATASPARAQAEPDYGPWDRILATYYDPAHGMDYAALKARDFAAVQKLRADLGRVNANALPPKARLAYWINVYNVNTVNTILENYPTKSIRDISTDPIIRINVFKKPRVPYGGSMLSLNDVENEKIRAAFHDPRIHFAINCAARSCPPLRKEAYSGARLDAQLDEQARAFLNGPHGARYEPRNKGLKVHVTKIMDWFGDDFEKWGGGKAAFLRRYVPADKQRMIDAAGGSIDFNYDDYDWSLNDWKR